MHNFKYIFSITALVFLLTSCGHNHKEGDDHDHDHSSHSETDDHEGHGHDSHEEGGLHLTQEQAQTVGLQFGDFTSVKANDYIKTTGTLGLPPNALSSVSAKASGIITDVNKYVEGAYIKKGEVIAYLENPDFIATQQEYLEIMAELALEQLEVDRQTTLVNADAGIAKDLQQAKAKAKILSTKAKGLSKQLAYIGIPTSNLTSDNISQRIAITSPSSGYISEVEMHNGMFAERSSTLMEIISSQHLHLELDVFESDISKVKKGLKISYNVPALGSTIYQGEVDVIAKEFNSEAKTVRVHGHIKDDKPQFIKDLFLNAKIWLTDNTVQALPEKAVISDGATSFIFAAVNNKEVDEIEFVKLMVVPGPTTDGFTSIKLVDPVPSDMEIVTEGAYYVYAQSKVGELAHEH